MALFLSSSELSQCSGDAAREAEKADSFIRELYKELDKHQLNLQSVSLTENAAKNEARISEIEADLARSQAYCARLLQEKEPIKRHNVWLNEELTSKVDGLIRLRRTHADLEADMSTKLAEVERQFSECSNSLNWKKETVKELETKLISTQEEMETAVVDGNDPLTTVGEPKQCTTKYAMRKRKVVQTGGSLWSTIPDDILFLISEKLTFIEDIVRFCAVCRSWYSFGADHCSSRDFPPLFMHGDDSFTTKRTLINYILGNSFVLELPEAAGRRCWGSPFGWIVTFGVHNLEFSLLNPLSRATIALPSLHTLLPNYNPNKRFTKAILTASPDSPDCLVVLMIRPSKKRNILGFAKPGDEVWSRIRCCPDNLGDLNDVLWFQGSLYGCRRSNLDLVLIQPPMAMRFAVLPQDLAGDRSLGYGWDEVVEQDEFRSVKYLVDLGGNLCLVLRYTDAITTQHFTNAVTYHFKIFKIDMTTKKWTRVFPSIEDYCLFVGNNYTFAYKDRETATSASKHFKANFIYYTNDDLSIYKRDEGIYNSRTCGEVDVSNGNFIINPSLWITPRLKFARLDKYLWPKEGDAWTAERGATAV